MSASDAKQRTEPVGAEPPPASATTGQGAKPPAAPIDRRQLAEQYMPYVHSIAGKIKRGVAREVPLEDLVEYGMIGLLEAADRYDPNQGANFMTFAYYRIRGAIYDGLRGMGWMTRTDYARARFEERANNLLAELSDNLGSGVPLEGSSTKPASALEGVVQDLATAVHGLAAVYITTMDGAALANIKDDKSVATEDKIALDQARTLVRNTIKRLSEQERQLLELYYYKDHNLADAGRKLGLSKSWTSRLHARVIQKLHRMLEESLG